MKNILERLYFHNPWWKTREVNLNLALPQKRNAYQEIIQGEELERIIVIKGPRRTGKTTLIYQRINHLLQAGTKPENILYFSGDDVDLEGRVQQIINKWLAEFNLKLEDKEELYVFIDEAQFIRDWEKDIKLLYDKKLSISFYASGSVATLIRSDTESLAGRTYEITTLPLTFNEYLRLSSRPDINLNGSPEGQANALRKSWKHYLKQGAFPHTLGLSPETIQRVIKEDIIDTAIYKDIVTQYGVREPSSLERLFRFLAENSGGLENVSKLSSSFNLSWEIVQKYLSYLKNSYLIFSLPKYSQSAHTTARSLAKVHVIDSALISLFQMNPREIQWESVIARHLWEIYGRNTYHWRDKREIDIVVQTKQGLLPIEVTTSSKGKEKLKSFNNFQKKNNFQHGYIIYNGEPNSVSLNKNTTIHLTNPWNFLWHLPQIPFFSS